MRGLAGIGLDSMGGAAAFSRPTAIPPRREWSLRSLPSRRQDARSIAALPSPRLASTAMTIKTVQLRGCRLGADTAIKCGQRHAGQEGGSFPTCFMIVAAS